VLLATAARSGFVKETEQRGTGMGWSRRGHEYLLDQELKLSRPFHELVSCVSRQYFSLLLLS